MQFLSYKKNSRASHSKSRTGCVNCKQRHQKCDEVQPSCLRCQRRGIRCIQPVAPAAPNKSARFRGFKILTPTTLKFGGRVNSREAGAFEYFHLYVLPILQVCQTSGLWKHTLGFHAQISIAIRKILTAIGFQYRLSAAGEGEPRIKELSYLTNLSYVNAVRSLRLSIGSRTAEDAAVLPFGCLLLALLESFRDSPREMLIHLNSGVQMISEMSTSLRTSSDIREIAGMIQDNCIECRLFCASPAYTGDFAAVTMALEIDPITLSELSHAKDLSLELNRIVGATMRTMHRMRKAGNDVKRRNSLFSSMIKLCYRWDRLRALLEKEEVGSKIQSPGRSCLRAGYILMGIFLHSATSGVKPGSGEEIASFIEIVDLVENALNQLDCIDAYDQKRPQSFTVGLRTIQLLDAVITQCPDTPLRFRALRLLDRSPRKEGLWTASSTRDACLAILQSECDKASKESRRDMPVRPRENSDPPNSQAQLTPGILRHLEGPAHSLDQSIADQDD